MPKTMAGADSFGDGDAQSAEPGSSGTVALSKTMAYVATGKALQAVDITTGKTRATITPAGHLAASDSGTSQDDPPKPVVTTWHGRPVVLVAYLTAKSGHGTTSGSLAVELDVVDAASARPTTRVNVPVPGDPEQAEYEPAPVPVLGETSGDVVISGGENEVAPGAMAVSIDDRKKSWAHEHGTFSALTGNTVIGTTQDGFMDGGKLIGLKLSTGKKRWTGDSKLEEATISAAGAGNVLINATDWSSGNQSLIFVSGQSGEQHDVIESSGSGLGGRSSYTCIYDEKRTDVCQDTGHQTAFAIDAKTGKQLWSMSKQDDSQLVPKITTAWHGAAYGITQNGSLVMNARTGKDRNDAPGVAPTVVDGYMGLAEVPDAVPQKLGAYRVTE